MDEFYENWKTKTKENLLNNSEDIKFINYILDWFDSMSGDEEINLIQEYHPSLKNKSSKKIMKFINKARYHTENMNNQEFRQQTFDSALFLYKPLLKLRYEEENYI